MNYTIVTLGQATTLHVPGLVADPPLYIESRRNSLVRGTDMWNDAPVRPACTAITRAMDAGTAPVVVARAQTLNQVLAELAQGRACKQCLKAAQRDQRIEQAWHNLRVRRTRAEVDAVVAGVKELALAGDLWAAGAYSFAEWLLTGTGLDINHDRPDATPRVRGVAVLVDSRLREEVRQHPDL